MFRFNMTNVDIEAKIYKKWVSFYKRHSKIDYPTLKNFTTKKLSELIGNSKRNKKS